MKNCVLAWAMAGPFPVEGKHSLRPPGGFSPHRPQLPIKRQRCLALAHRTSTSLRSLVGALASNKSLAKQDFPNPTAKECH